MSFCCPVNDKPHTPRDITLIDESTQRYPLAMVEIDCLFFIGKTEALCMDDTLYDLVIGNIDGSKLPDMSHFSAAAVTRAQFFGWLVGFGFIGPLRQYFSLYRAVSL